MNEIIDGNDKSYNCRDELLDCINEIKIKHDYFSIFKKNKREYVIVIGIVCLNLTLSLKHSELEFNTHNLKPDLYVYHLLKLQQSRDKHGFN